MVAEAALQRASVVAGAGGREEAPVVDLGHQRGGAADRGAIRKLRIERARRREAIQAKAVVEDGELILFEVRHQANLLAQRAEVPHAGELR